MIFAIRDVTSHVGYIKIIWIIYKHKELMYINLLAFLDQPVMDCFINFLREFDKYVPIW